MFNRPFLSTCLAFPIAIELSTLEHRSGLPNELKGERRAYRTKELARLEKRIRDNNLLVIPTDWQQP